MRVFFDTSVLVAACVEGHPEHERSFAWLAQAHRREIEMVIATHTLAELYAVLTRLPVRPRLVPSIVRLIIRDSIEANAQVVEITAGQYREVFDEMVHQNLTGGIVYDALAVSVAKQQEVDVLLTLNSKDFLRVWPENEGKIREP